MRSCCWGRKWNTTCENILGIIFLFFNNFAEMYFKDYTIKHFLRTVQEFFGNFHSDYTIKLSQFQHIFIHLIHVQLILASISHPLKPLICFMSPSCLCKAFPVSGFIEYVVPCNFFYLVSCFGVHPWGSICQYSFS